MLKNNITIEKILEALNDNVIGLNYEIDNNSITLKKSTDKGFDIIIHLDQRESMIIFGKGGHHCHFDHRFESFEELIELLVFSLVGFSRIIEYHWDGKPRKFSYQEIDDNEGWTTMMKMSFPKWKFWKKNTLIEEKVVQNDYQLKQKTNANN